MADEELYKALADQLADEYEAVVSGVAPSIHMTVRDPPPAHPDLRDRLAGLFLALRRNGTPPGMILSVHGQLVAAVAAASDTDWPAVKASLERQFVQRG
jgi:hypothetical protein